MNPISRLIPSIAAFSIALVLTCLSLAQPWLVRPLVDDGFGSAPGAEASFRLILLFVGIMFALAVLRVLGQMVQLRLSLGLGTLVSRAVRNAVYAHLHRLSLSFFARRQTGALVSEMR